MRLYTQCPNCEHLVVVEGSTLDGVTIECDECGHRITARELREPFQRQIDEGPTLSAEARKVKGPTPWQG